VKLNEEGERRITLRDKRGSRRAQPSEDDFSDRELIVFQNISEDINVWARHPNGLVTHVRFMDVDTVTRGVYFMNRFPTLGQAEERSEAHRRTLKELKKYLYAEDIYRAVEGCQDAIVNKFFSRDNVALEEHAERLRRNPSDLTRELLILLRDWGDFKDYNMIRQDEFDNAKHVFVPTEGIMLSVGDEIAEYPEFKDTNELTNTITVKIRNSNNPLRRYYANVFGSVVSITVTNDDVEDGITIINTFGANKQEAKYPLSMMEELGIYTNADDAKENASTEVRLKLAELKVKEEGHSATRTTNHTKLEVERMNKEYAELKIKFEKEKLDWEREKVRIEEEKRRLEQELRDKEIQAEAAKREFEQRLRDRERKEEDRRKEQERRSEEVRRKLELEYEELRREHERVGMEHERKLMEARLKVELEKSINAKRKAEEDRRANTFKTVGSIITGGLAILGAVWKFFF